MQSKFLKQPGPWQKSVKNRKTFESLVLHITLHYCKDPSIVLAYRLNVRIGWHSILLQSKHETDDGLTSCMVLVYIMNCGLKQSLEQ